MIEKIIFSIISFILFAYIFLFKLVKKNDTSYLIILSLQAIGILINLIRILFEVLNDGFSKSIIYLLSIIIPTAILAIEFKGINIGEYIQIAFAKMYLLIDNKKSAKNVLIKLISKYDNSYIAHKMLAQIYEEEGGMRKAIDEYVRVLDIKPNDYKTYFKISILLYKLSRKDEAIHMLKTLVKNKPELYEANHMLRRVIIRKRKF